VCIHNDPCAAQRLNRNAIGMEKNEEFYNKAVATNEGRTGN